MPFYIYFAGLICHEGPNEERSTDRSTKTRSSILDDPVHTPWITSPAFDTPLTSDVFFEGLAPGPAVTDSVFRTDEHVPHLEDMTPSPVKLRRASRGHKVFLPGGTFTVACYFDYKAEYFFPSQLVGPSCIAQITLLLATPTADKVIVDFNRSQQSLNADSWLLLENASNDDPQPAGAIG